MIISFVYLLVSKKVIRRFIIHFDSSKELKMLVLLFTLDDLVEFISSSLFLM